MKTHGSILDDIVAYKRKETRERMAALPLADLEKRIEFAPPVRDFIGALRRKPGQPVRFLAEIKAASPSRGVIRDAVQPAIVAQQYESSGASALSVLTDGRYFGGSEDHLIQARSATDLPVLRKDIIIDEYQVWESRAIGADAVLLMAQILDQDELDRLLHLAHTLGMAALVEAHEVDELKTILQTQAQLVGINNRNFRTMKTDIRTTLRLREQVPADRVVVSQSGISTPGQVRLLSQAGVDAVQVGTALMARHDPGRALARLMRGAE